MTGDLNKWEWTHWRRFRLWQNNKIIRVSRTFTKQCLNVYKHVNYENEYIEIMGSTWKIKIAITMNSTALHSNRLWKETHCKHGVSKHGIQVDKLIRGNWCFNMWFSTPSLRVCLLVVGCWLDGWISGKEARLRRAINRIE